MPRTCVFCGGSAGSQEHAFPDWLNDVVPQPSKGDRAEWAHKIGSADGVALRTWTKAEVASLTTGHVCPSCNNGWMSRLEGRIRPLLSPAVVGQPVLWSEADQIEIAWWATKTAVVLETQAGRSGDSFSADEVRLVCGDTGRSPDHVRVSAAAVEGTIAPLGFLCCRAHMTDAQSGTRLCDLHLYTITLGALVLQVGRPSPPQPGYSVWQRTHVTLPAEGSLVPPIPSGRHWPPERIYSWDEVVRLSTRGMGIPEGWEPPSLAPQGGKPQSG